MRAENGLGLEPLVVTLQTRVRVSELSMRDQVPERGAALAYQPSRQPFTSVGRRTFTGSALIQPSSPVAVLSPKLNGRYPGAGRRPAICCASLGARTTVTV